MIALETSRPRWVQALWIQALCLLALTAAAGAQSWRQRAAEVPARGGPVAFDEARGRLVMAAGDDTWEWDGFGWVCRAPVPPHMAEYSQPPIAYDPVSRRVLMFGGFDLSRLSLLNETWAWDGFAWTLLSPGQSPSPRAAHSMVLDQARGRIVLFGGESLQGATTFGDTWEWTGTTWTRVATTGPSRRSTHATVYDPVRQRVMLFGGDSDPTYGNLQNDTWEWDGVSWTRRNVSGPSARDSAKMAWNEVSQRVVLYGGAAGLYQNPLADTWEWDGSSWTNVLAGGEPGRQAYGHSLAFESARGRVMITTSAGVWFWNGAHWEGSPSVPSGNDTHVSAYDAARAEVVLYSGNASADTWVWNGTRWRLAEESSAPGARVGHALAFDAARGETVLFGGGDASTWAWNGTTWQLRATTGPGARDGAAMAYDASRQRVVLFGGEDVSGFRGETWEWDGAAWSQVAPALAPPGRRAAALAFDPVRGRVVMFGGYGPGTRLYARTYFADTWEWDGSSWTERFPSGSPVGRESHGLAYDAAHGGVVLAGGEAFAGSQCDAWLWDGASWTPLAAGCGPTGVVALASDTARGELVALARPNASGPVATWELGASVPAAAVVSGSGCIGAGSPVPALASLGLPRRPRPGFAIDVGLVRASAPAALLIAAAGASVPLGSCVLHVDPQSTVSVPFTSSAAGFFSLPLPLGATLPQGLDLFGQAVVIDPAGAFAGLAFTNGLQLTIGE